MAWKKRVSTPGCGFVVSSEDWVVAVIMSLRSPFHVPVRKTT